MREKSVSDLASEFGLTVETIYVDRHENALRLYKGARQIFVGTAEAVRSFLSEYEQQRPGPMDGSMYGYRE